MKYEQKKSLLNSHDSDLPIMVQNNLRSTECGLNEDYDLGSTMSPLGEGGHTQMYLLFVQPFVDVLKSFKFMAMQFSNSLKLLWKIFTVFDPGEFEDEVDLYNERRQAINKAWEPLKKKVEEQLGRTDPFLKMSVMGPRLFFANKAFQAGLEAGKPIAEILTATGWEQLVNNFKTDFDPNENLNKNSARIQKNQQKLIKKLNRIFFTTPTSSYSFYESVGGEDDVLLEAEENEKPLTPEEQIIKFLKVSGIKDKQDETKIARSEGILASVPKIQKTMLPLIFSSEMLAVKSLEEFSKVIDKIKLAGGKLNISMSKIQEEINAGAKELAANEKFKEDFVKKNRLTSADQINPEKLLEEARLSIFSSSKESLNMQVQAQLKSAIPLIEKSLEKIKIDDETLSAMSQDEFEVVKRAAKVYKNLEDSYKKIQENYKEAFSK